MVLCDGNEAGAIPPEYIVALFSIVNTKDARPVMTRLDSEEAVRGIRPVSAFQGEDEFAPTPGLKSIVANRPDYAAQSRPQREALYGPNSLRAGTNSLRDDVTDDLTPPRLTPRDSQRPNLTHRIDFRATGFLKRSPALAPHSESSHKRRKSSPVTASAPSVSPKASTRSDAASPSPKPKSAANASPLPKPSSAPKATIESDKVDDVPADYDDVETSSEAPVGPPYFS